MLAEVVEGIGADAAGEACEGDAPASSAVGTTAPAIGSLDLVVDDGDVHDVPDGTDQLTGKSERIPWCTAFLAALDAPQRALLEQIMARGLRWSTHYSGVGFFEVALHDLAAAFGKQADVVVSSATEINPRCRQMLQAHVGPCRPHCLFRDLTRRISAHAKTHMREVLAHFRQELQQKTISCMDRRKATKIKEEIVEEFMGALDAVMLQAPLTSTDYCYNCQQPCEVSQHMTGKLNPEEITGNAAGSTCTPWSAFGKRMNHLSTIMICFCAWIAERCRVQEDIIFHECTALHPSEKLFSRYLAKDYILSARVVCPGQFGFPARRARQMMVAVRSTPLCKSPADLLFKPINTSVLDYFIATEAQHEAHIVREAAEHKSNPVVIRDLLTPCQEKILRGYEEWLRNQGPCTGPFLFNVTQNCQFMGGGLAHLPCLLRKSVMWAHDLQRYMLGQEAMCCMSDRNGIESSPWKEEVVQRMPEVELRSMAGNGMHVPSVGAMLIWALLSCSAVDSERD